jgi:Putative bacterial sensory transduction regulator
VGRLDRIRPYLEKLLREGFAIPDLAPDDEGDYPFRFRSAGYYVRLINEQSPTVQLFSVAVHDIKRSPKLMGKLNEVNAALSFVRVYWLDGKVVVSTELVAETLDAEELGNACNIVGRAADGIGRTLVAEFGGHVLFEDADEDGTGKPPMPAAGSAERASYL